MRKKILNLALILFFVFVSTQNILICKTVYVDNARPNDGGNGLTWATAEKTIIAGLIDCSAGDVLLIKYGTYTLANTITLSANIKISSDDGDGTEWDDAEPDSSLCILDGANLYRVLQFTSSATTNSLVVRGFKIYRGNATSSSTNGRSGGGILIKGGADPIIERCWITECRANTTAPSPASYATSGGGIFIQDSEPIIRNNRIDNNYATYTNNPGYGGGISVYNTNTSGGNPAITGNYIANNVATYVVGEGFYSNGPSLGGGLQVSMSSPLIENNIFYNNWGFRRYITSGSTDSYACGGAIALDQSSSLIKNNTFNSNYAFYENEGRYGLGATGRGGALYLTSFNGTIENNVFYKNTAVYYNANNATYLGNAINAVSGTPVIKNNIFSENKYLTRLTEACIRNSSLTSITIDYNCFYNNHPNENVTSNNEVTTDPLFTNAASNNFTLQSSSPCINTGDPLSAVESGGEPIIDMGIEEFISFASATYNSIDNSISDNIIPGKSLAVASVGSNISSIIELSISTPPNSSGERTVGRYWDISSTGDANIRLYFPTSAISEFTGAPTIFHYNGSNWEAIPTGAVQSAGTSSYVESSSPITSWSYFTVGDSEDPLPVELTSFAASVSNGKVILNWKTSTEVNNYGFEIQKMAKGKAQSAVPNGRQAEWEMVGFIEGSGNSNTPKSYSFTDNLTSYSYAYRIKQIDLDGSFTYSKEISVDAASFLPTEFILSQNYPNPFNPVTTIKYSVPSTVYVVLKIFDMLGRETTTLVNAQQPAGYYEVKFDASNLASGIYLYNLQAGEFSSVKKLILMK